jgi:hypothetical protein
MEFEFFDKRSEKSYNIFLKNDKFGNFKNYFQSLNKQENIYNTNRMPDNNCLTFVAFQAVEIYNTFNKDEVKNNLYRFAKIAAKNDKNKLLQLRKKADEIIEKMISNKYIRSSNLMHDFSLEINQKFIKYIKIFFDTIGSGLYKIGYNIYLQDEFYYKYWLLMVNNFPNLLQIKKIPFINRGKIIFHNGDSLKSKHIIEFTNMAKKEINKIVKKLAPGIFTNLYENIPIIMVIDIDKINYRYKYSQFLFQVKNMPEDETTSFNELLRNDNTNDHTDFYYNRISYDIYIPSKINNYLKPVIFSKHIRKPEINVPTTLLFWLEIITQLYKIQSNQIDSIQNGYIYKTIKNNFLGLSKSRNKLYQTDALLKLLEGSYEIEKKSFEEPYNENYMHYYLNDSDEFKIEYFTNSIDSIKWAKKKLKKALPVVSEIYDKKNQDNNNKSNIFFQIIAIILTIFIVIQTVYQCALPKENENKDDKNMKNENFYEGDMNICSIEKDK